MYENFLERKKNFKITVNYHEMWQKMRLQIRFQVMKFDIPNFLKYQKSNYTFFFSLKKKLTKENYLNNLFKSAISRND
jgi:hypothetical protein